MVTGDQHMQKQTIYGLPMNPTHLLEQLEGGSFCVSYATRKKLGKQLEQAIRLVGQDGILLVDNGAFSAHQKGIDTMNDEGYLNGFATWANDIADRCPQAIIVIPDVIGGSANDNWLLTLKSMGLVYCDRAMPIWHMHEPIEYLVRLAGMFTYIGIGSSAQYWKVGTKAWHARIRQAFAALAELEAATGQPRPQIHMMRAQAQAHLYDFDSSDSTNVAVNHNRQRRKTGQTVREFAARVDAKIQASCDRVEAAYQKAAKEFAGKTMGEVAAILLPQLGFAVKVVDANGNEIELAADELRRLERCNEDEEEGVLAEILAARRPQLDLFAA
jgi:hypothetical protein